METNSSLDRLAHIANITHELGELDRHIKEEKPDPKTPALDSTPSAEDRIDFSDDKSDLRNKIRKLACTGCRQQKLKCDARERQPLPCSRCDAKGLLCELKPEFKRTEKRARIAVIEKQFEELKKSFVEPVYRPLLLATSSPLPDVEGRLSQVNLNLNLLSLQILQSLGLGNLGNLGTSASPILGHGVNAAVVGQNLGALGLNLGVNPGALGLNLGVNPGTLGANLGPRSSLGTPGKPEVVLKSSPVHLVESALHCEEKTLDDITLSSDTIRRLYLEYVRRYHPIMPVVDVLKGPERIHRLCPALFWVLMFVALRRISADKSLLLKLSPHIKNILAEITISPITRYNPTEDDEPVMNASSVYSVQAFILYTLWPPLTSSLSADSSWNTIGVALFQAIRIGLHSSGSLLGHDNPQQLAMAQEHVKTWVVCNIVAQNIATAFGFPAFVQFELLQPQKLLLPLATRHLMEIAHFEDQVAKTLGLNSTAEPLVAALTERISLIKVLLKQLDDLELRHLFEGSDDDHYRKMRYIIARVHLLTYYFLDAHKMPAFELSKGLVRLYNAAILLVNHVEMCQARDRYFVQYIPVVLMLNLWLASCIIVKLVNSPLKMVIDVDAGKLIYSHAIALVAKALVLKHDIAYRASGIMRNMWQLFRSLDEKNLTGVLIKIRSRMAASVFFDCLLLLRDQVGMAKLNIITDARENGDGVADGDDLLEEDDKQAEAVVSSDDESAEKRPSVKSTPSSSSSSMRRKKRSLSGNDDAESKARKIIRTIPLDPQPIAASKKSNIFKVMDGGSDTSPNTSGVSGASGAGGAGVSPMPPPAKNTLAFIDFAEKPDGYTLPLSEWKPEMAKGYKQQLESPVVPPTNLELEAFDINNDMLWKDVDSLMNDFGFHS